MPGPRTSAAAGGAGLFLIFGHFFIFMAYRVGPTSVVAPFYYCFTVWAVIAGVWSSATCPTRWRSPASRVVTRAASPSSASERRASSGAVA